MKRTMLVIAALLIWGTPFTSWAIEGFSGAFWGIGIYDTLESNPKTLGFIRQGIDWIKVYDTNLSTYAQFRYRFEKEQAEFFDAYGPSLGVSLKRGPFRLGWEYEWERLPKQHKEETKSQFFLEWYFGWDLKDLKR